MLRARLARILDLRWVRFGRVPLATPAAILLVAIGSWSQLGRPVAGVPLGFVWVAGSAAALAVVAALPRIRSRPGVALVVVVVIGWLLIDLLRWQGSNHLYDLNVYVGSAGRWMDGGRPYMTGPISVWPSSPQADFFLYPPPLLPVFGLLSRLPNAAVSVAWVVLLLACSYAAFRALGLRPVWSLVMLAFPPLMIGIESGNVASLVFFLFASGYRAGGRLVVGGVFKAQTGLPALWLIRSRRWRPLAAGVAAVAAAVAITLPLVGIDSWRAWIAELGYRAASQPAVPALFGSSFARVEPGAAFVAISAAFVALALLFTGRRGLAALGLASIYASPALWAHGFLFAVPAVLMLESGAAVWLILGVGSFGPSWWLLFYAGWLAVTAEPRPPDAAHPMAGTDGPWSAPTIATRPGRRRPAGCATICMPPPTVQRDR
jgi:hypothetical protein